MAVFWSSKIPNGITVSEILAVRNVFCKQCNSITEQVVKSKEFRSVLGSKFDGVDFKLICQQCKYYNKLEKNDKKKLKEEFQQKQQQQKIISKGFILYNEGKYDTAIKLFDQILFNTKNDLATYGKASCLISLGKYAKASELARYLESRYPKSNDVIDMVNFLHKNNILW